MVYFGLAYIHLRKSERAEAIDLARQSVELLAPSGTWHLYLDQGERARIVCQVLTEAEHMLASFVTHRQKGVPLERAAEAVWPERDGGDRAFHSALYRLRQALRRERENTKFILVIGGEYQLESGRFLCDC